MRRVLLAVGLLSLISCGGGSGSPSAPSAPAISLNGNLGFGNVLVGSTWTATLTISNSGNAALTVTSISGPSGYTASWTSGSIPAGGSQAVTIGFSPSAPGDYNGSITVNANQASGGNTIAVSGSAFPVINGAWAGTSTSSAAGLSGVCNMSWIVSGQTGSEFSGTWQTSGSRCGQAGTLSGTVTTNSDLANVSFHATVAPSSCTRIAGDGMFNGVFANGVATIQSADAIRCSGFPDITRSMTVAMRKQ